MTLDLARLVELVAVALIVYVVAGSAKAAALRTWSRYQSWKIERTLRFTGEYRTTFREPKSGPSDRHEELSLWQSGRRLEGYSDMRQDEEDRREWVLIADIREDGFIDGRYWSVLDDGAGIFILKSDLDNPRAYRGWWTGYDPDTRKVESGTYEWLRTSASPRRPREEIRRLSRGRRRR